MRISKLNLVTTLTFLAMTAAASAADMIGNCELSGVKGSIPIAKPAVANQLTVEVSLPAPIWWNGDKADAIKDGMEYCMAAEIAWRAGFDNVKLVAVDFQPLVMGRTEGYDLALSEVSITEEREKYVDFSVPYFSSDIGVLTRTDTPVEGKTIRDFTVGLQQATTGASYAIDTLELLNTKVFADRGDMFKALSAGDIDAVMTDTSITLAQEVGSGGKLKVVGQYKTDETYGAVFPKGSANGPTINKIITAMIQDGTMKKLSEKYLAAAWGKDPASVPYFTK